MPDLTAALGRLDDELSVFRRLINAVQAVQVEALKDPLTPLGNSRALTQALEQAIQSEKPHFVVFGDLTGFKAINDRHGHATGDAVIRGTGKWLKEIAERHEVSAFRQSGDEFVLLGHEDVREAVCQSLGEPIPDVVVDEEPISVQANFGVANLDAAPLAAIKNAENACACAKQSGTPVVTWTGSLPLHTQRRWRCAHCHASIRVDCAPDRHLTCPVCGSAGPQASTTE